MRDSLTARRKRRLLSVLPGMLLLAALALGLVPAQAFGAGGTVTVTASEVTDDPALGAVQFTLYRLAGTEECGPEGCLEADGKTYVPVEMPGLANPVTLAAEKRTLDADGKEAYDFTSVYAEWTGLAKTRPDGTEEVYYVLQTGICTALPEAAEEAEGNADDGMRENDLVFDTDMSGYTVSGGTVAMEGDRGTAVIVTLTAPPPAAGGSLTLKGAMVFEGGSLGDAEFTFSLKEDGVLLSEAAADAYGRFAFPALAYTAEDLGRHTYTVSQDPGPERTILRDDAVYTVEVDVADNGDGTLRAERTIRKDGAEAGTIVFVNRVSETRLTLSLVREGGDDGEGFTFRLELALDGEALEGTYRYTGSAEGDIASGGEIRLEDGGSVTVEGLPVGTAFRLSQIRNGSYITRMSLNGGEEQRTGEAAGTLDSEGGAEVTFRNTRTTAELRVTNRWNGDDRGRIDLYVYVGIKADVLAHGVMQMKMMDPQPVMEREGNVYTLLNQPLEDAYGNELVYAVQEYNIPEDHYVSYLNMGEYQNFYTFAFNEGEIINTFEGPRYVSINVYQRWTGTGERDALPDITLDVYRINPDRTSQVVKTLTVSAENNTRVSIGGLLDGYYYYVMVQPVAGYSASYVDRHGEKADVAYPEGVVVCHKIPRTGDSRPAEAWAGAALVSLGGIGAVILTERRRRRRQS